MSVLSRCVAGAACVLALAAVPQPSGGTAPGAASDVQVLKAEVRSLARVADRLRHGRAHGVQGIVESLDELASLRARLLDRGASHPELDGLRLDLDLDLIEADLRGLLPPAARGAHPFKSGDRLLTVGTGSITGTVTDAATGLPLSGVTVQVYTCSGRYAVAGRTDAMGAYSTPATLAAGTYLARTRNSSGYIDQLYRGTDCPGSCDVLAGTPIGVGAGPARIQFALRRGGRIAGVVRDDAGVALPDVTVEIHDAWGAQVTSGMTDVTGAYTSDGGLPTGRYYATTANPHGLLDELYDDLPCALSSCEPTLGTPIAVTVGLTTSGIDFVLNGAGGGGPPGGTGGRISGTVTDASGAPVSGTVWIYDATGIRVAFARIDDAGSYTSDPVLPTGDYFARTFAFDNHIDELYDATPCVVCTPTTGTPISVTAGETTSGIDFVLDTGGSIRAWVTEGGTATPLEGASVLVYTSTGSFVAGRVTDAAGTVAVEKLTTGSYRVLVGGPAGQGYVRQLYYGRPCVACPITSGEPVGVLVNWTTHVALGLVKGGRIAGTITDSATGSARKGYYLDVYTSSGQYAGNARSNCGDNATYLAPDDGLTTGTYFVRGDGRRNQPYPYGYRLQLYKLRDCVGCRPTSGDGVAVTEGLTTSGIDFKPVRRRRPGDYDRDGRSDITVFRPDTADWFIRSASGVTTHVVYGGGGVPVPQDYDQDGKTDVAVYQPATGHWRARRSSTGIELEVTLGGPGSTPVRGDFDGDRRADHAVVSDAGVWSIRSSRTGDVEDVSLGTAGSVPVPADYDGDDKTDVAVYDSGVWQIRRSRTSTVETLTFGGPGHTPVTGDFDGDGKADLATFDEASQVWWIQYSSDGTVKNGRFGAVGGLRVPFEYDGDGKTDLVVYHPVTGVWEILRSSTMTQVTVGYGGPGFLPQN